jgi:hypothetical protein
MGLIWRRRNAGINTNLNGHQGESRNEERIHVAQYGQE